MDDTRRRTIVTAIVASLGAFFGIAGVGHAYLRQWRRSIVWFLLAIGSGIALVFYYVEDPAAIDPFDAGAIPQEVYIPLFVIIALSVIDAVLLSIAAGRTEPDERLAANAIDSDSTPIEDVGADGSTPEPESVPACPECGKDTDPELDFCPWCTYEFEQPPDAED